MCAFQRFESFGARMTPRVSIRGNGQIGLSAGALRMFGIDDGNTKVVLYYDSDAKLVAFKPTNDPAEAFAVPVLVRHLRAGGQEGTKYGQISGRSFLERFQIPYHDKTRAFDPYQDKETGFFVINLAKERVSRRKRKADPQAGSAAGAKDDAGA